MKFITKQFYKENSGLYKRTISPLKESKGITVNIFKTKTKQKKSLLIEVQKFVDIDLSRLSENISKSDFISYEKYQQNLNFLAVTKGFTLVQDLSDLTTEERDSI